MAKHNLILNNFFLKLTALMLAIVVWLVFHRSDQSILAGKEGAGVKNLTRKSFERLPVHILQASGENRRFSLGTSTVNAELSGDEASMKILTTNEIHAFVDVTTFRPDRAFLSIQIQVPNRIRSENTTPKEVHVNLLQP